MTKLSDAVTDCFSQIEDPHLRDHLIDFGVQSGPSIATQTLQGILGIDRTGQLGSNTLASLAIRDQRTINNRLVVERVKMIGRVVVTRPAQLGLLGGWLEHALTFIR